MWGVPVNHEMFSEINSTQWMWYFYNFMEDRDSEFTDRRDLIEYHASFIEPEAVGKVREARDSSVDVPHDEFVDGIEHFFGRKIGISQEKRKGGATVSVDPKQAIKESNEFKKEQDNSNAQAAKLDYAHGLKIDLE